MIDEQTDDDQRDSRVRIKLPQQRNGHHQQSHLTDGGIAQQAPRPGLAEADQI